MDVMIESITKNITVQQNWIQMTSYDFDRFNVKMEARLSEKARRPV